MESNRNLELKTYLIMISGLTLLTGFNSFISGGNQFITNSLPLPGILQIVLNMLIVLFLYGLLGLYGIKIGREFNLPGIWPDSYPGFRYWLEPAVLGLGLTALYIVLDLSFAPIHNLGYLPQPELPEAILVVLISAISGELLFRLFLIPFGAYIIVMLWRNFGGIGLEAKEQIIKRVFWPLAGISGVVYVFSYLPNLIYSYGVESLFNLPVPLLIQLLLMYGSLGMLAAWQYRRQGFLAAVQVHFWAALFWHIGWGGIF